MPTKGSPHYPEGGLLLKDGRQTSCEVVPLDHVSGFVAASCLDLDADNKELNADTKHEIALRYSGSNEVMRYGLDPDSSTVWIHTGYVPSTYAYNIAVVLWGEKQDGTIDSQIAQAGDNLGSQIRYRQLTLADDLKTWNDWRYLPVDMEEDARCSSWPQYEGAKAWFQCTSQTTDVELGGQKHANAVYGSADLGRDGYFYMLYSHSIADDDDLESAKTVTSYYTALSGYAVFANSTLGQYITVVDNTFTRLPNAPPVLMIATPNAHILGRTLIGGDLYALMAIDISLPDDDDDDIESTNSGDKDSSEDSSEDSAKSGGLSGGAIAGIVIGVILALLVAGVLVWWVRRMRARQQAESYWDQEVEKMRSVMSLGSGQQQPQAPTTGELPTPTSIHEILAH
ncbi:hypothetical protein GGF46_003801 [Coemansia sp. RSA 552]|nr:hypothetical protein GGF46_003801 [Coemansia sp. RSA 552]